MNVTSGSRPRRLVLAGAGHAHVFVLERFAQRPLANVELTVVSREARTPYSGMVPGFIAGHYAEGEISVDVPRLARAAGATLLLDEVVGLDLDGRRVRLRSGGDVPFDLLSLDTGSAPSLDVDGATENALAVKPIGRFVPRVTEWLEDARELLRERAVRVAVVGGGAGGTEVAFALAHRLRTDARALGVDPERVEVALLAACELLPDFAAGARTRLARLCGERGVKLLTNARAARVDSDGVTLADGSHVAADRVVWTTNAAAPGWPAGAGLATLDGFVLTDATLRSVSHPFVFAAGDGATVRGDRRAKAGVWAVRAGPPLADNLVAALQAPDSSEPSLRRHRPRREALAIVSTGPKHAVAVYGRWSVEGEWVWRWKDWLDRRFVTRFNGVTGAVAARAEPRDAGEAAR